MTTLVAWLRAYPFPMALVYLLALTAAEFLTLALDPRLGLAANSVLMAALTVHTALCWRRPFYKLFLSLSIVPLVRLVSLTMPLARFPIIYWYLMTSVPLMAAAALVAGVVGFTPRRIGLWLRKPVWRAGMVQLAIGTTGLLFGYIEHLLLRPEMAVEAATWRDLLLPALIMLICTGFAEELIFRGVMQRAALEALGGWGPWYVSALFAMLHMGHAAWLDIPFVFGVAVFFAWIARRTGSILGVTLAHGLTNIMLFLVMPALARGG